MLEPTFDPTLERTVGHSSVTAVVSASALVVVVSVITAVADRGGIWWAWLLAVAVLGVVVLRRRGQQPHDPPVTRRQPSGCPACGIDAPRSHRSCRACGHELRGAPVRT